MHVNSSACVRVKGSESNSFKINSGVKHGCVVSPVLYSMCIDGIRRQKKIWDG